MSDRGRSNREIYRRVFGEARPYWPHIGGLLLLSLLGVPLSLLTPLPLKIAVDSAIGDHPVPGFLRAILPDAITQPGGAALALAAGLTVAVALLGQVRGLASGMLRTWTGERLVLDFRAKLFRHAQRLSLAYHDRAGTTDATYRIQHDAPAVQWIAIDGVTPFVTSTVTVVSMILVTAGVSFQLALVALAVAPALYLISRVYGRRLRGEWRGAKKLESSVMAIVQEVLGGVRLVKAFGQEEREERRFVGRAVEGVRAKVRLALLEGGLGFLIALTTAVGTATVLYVGVRQVQSGALTLGNLLLVMGYLSQLYKPLETMSKKIGDLQSSLASAERALFLLDQAPDVAERPHARPLRRAEGGIAFEDVTFAYEEGQPVLRDISFAVPPGARVGIAGPTGSGKTTLLNLLTRFYDPTEGRILLDGVDLRDYKVADLRNQFAIVLQEPVLFSSSIGENIAYARPHATDAEVVAAAEAAGAHDFIAGLPDGYGTLVGERGMRLSGGQRQRISLARAFLKDAPILLFDEPTSSVDVKTEAAIMAAMERLMRGRTTFMIAHRLGTLDGCDLLLTVDPERVHLRPHHGHRHREAAAGELVGAAPAPAATR